MSNAISYRDGSGLAPMKVTIEVAGGDYAIRFGYDPSLLDKFKRAVPEHERRWVDSKKVWLVTSDKIETARTFLSNYLSLPIELPQPGPAPREVLEKTFRLEYVGATKPRGGKRSAFGYAHGDWSVEFPEEVIQNFFEGEQSAKAPNGTQTLYQALCVPENAPADDIKKAYRRLVRQWHPDVCQEENAAEMFRRINEAYETLMNPEMRQRYDAGLYFERQGRIEPSKPDRNDYCPPLRCGLVTARGVVKLMRLVVDEILSWEDVINDQGRVMMSHWPPGAKKFQIVWV